MKISRYLNHKVKYPGPAGPKFFVRRPCITHCVIIFRNEFLIPLGISQNKLARDIDVAPRRINEIVHGKRSITVDTDLRLSRALGTSEGFWLGLQTDYDLEEEKKIIHKKLQKIKMISHNAA